MHSFDSPYASISRAVLYTIVACLFVAELAVLWTALHPNVAPDYRAFYIDHTTTCLNRTVTSGAYSIGETVSFRPDGAAKARSLKVCGWSGAVGNGTHSLGEMSRLRFALDSQAPSVDLILTLEVAPVLRPGTPAQDVSVSANGRQLHRATLTNQEPATIDVPLDRSTLHESGVLEIQLDYPNSIATSRLASNTSNRAIKLLSLRLDEPSPLDD